MLSAKTDRRTERTRSALMSAFVELLLARGYDDVTVEDVVARANVGRSTFYVHYKSKEDILKQSMQRPSSALAVIVGHDLSPETLVPVLIHFQEQRKLNAVFFSGPVRLIWVRCLVEMIEPRLARVAREARARAILPLGFIALQLAENQLSIVANWLTGKCPCAAEAIAQALIASTHAMMAALLRSKNDASLFIPGERIRVLHQD